MKRYGLSLLLLALWISGSEAANRFWNPYIVTGAISGAGGVCQLTISPAITGSGLVAGTSVNVTGITGATGCNVSASISAVVDSTHIELTGTTFGGVYVSGGCAAGGIWTTTNTSNWAATSTATCGSGGSSVPGTADIPILDANSLAGSVVPAATITNISGLTTSAFVGTLDFSINNPSFTLSGTWTDTATGVHTTNMGSGTWTFSQVNGTPIALTASANHTLNANTSTILISAVPTANRTITLGAKTVNNLTVTNAAWQPFGIMFDSAGSFTVAGNLTLTNVGQVRLQAAATVTVTGTITWDGNATNQGYLYTSGAATTLSVGSANTLSYLLVQSVAKSGAGSITVNNGFDGGGNTSVTVNAPSGGVKSVIGG